MTERVATKSLTSSREKDLGQKRSVEERERPEKGSWRSGPMKVIRGNSLKTGKGRGRSLKKRKEDVNLHYVNFQDCNRSLKEKVEEGEEMMAMLRLICLRGGEGESPM